LSPSQTSLPRPASTTRARSYRRTDLPARRRLKALATLTSLLLIAAIAGCGSGGDPQPSDTADSGTAERETTTGPGARPPIGDGDGGVTLEKLGDFQAPLFVAQPPGEDEDLYVVQQGGQLIRLEPDGSTSVFLDIAGEITAGGEQGLLSVAFAPDFQRSGLFYVDYTDTAGDTRVVEYRTGADGSADPSSRRELLRIDQPFANHNGGLLLFGPDDKLYIGTGDGGSAGDPDRNGQDLSTLLGKILRIDPRPSGPSGPPGDLPYAVPADNPFVSSSDARGEIWAYGLRNPWRFSFDAGRGWLAIGDVGQDSLEEIDLVADGSGANFGWSAFEGDERFNDDQQAPDAVAPALTYPREGDNCSVTGGYVVRDRDLPSLFGRYLYGDFCAGELRSFSAEPGARASDDRALGVSVESLSSFGTDNDGAIYATSLSGPVYRLVAEG
jgi:glucose/arabinose dehydrogenase